MLYMSSKQPSTLEQAILLAGLSIDNTQFSQLVHVTAKNTSAKIRCYEKDEAGLWNHNTSLGIISGFVGKNGISYCKKEGDGCTPFGLFPLGFAFGNREKPRTNMAYRPITQCSYWVDDPISDHYNQWVELNEKAEWTSAEYLYHYKESYAYAIVIAYNTAQITRGKGSAIFLHCGDKPTAGCIATREECLLKILHWLDPDKSPMILVTV